MWKQKPEMCFPYFSLQLIQYLFKKRRRRKIVTNEFYKKKIRKCAIVQNWKNICEEVAKVEHDVTNSLIY